MDRHEQEPDAPRLSIVVGLESVCASIGHSRSLQIPVWQTRLEFALDFEWRFPGNATLLLPEERMWSDPELTPIEPINRVSDYEMVDRDRLPGLY